MVDLLQWQALEVEASADSFSSAASGTSIDSGTTMTSNGISGLGMLYHIRVLIPCYKVCSSHTHRPFPSARDILLAHWLCTFTHLTRCCSHGAEWHRRTSRSCRRRSTPFARLPCPLVRFCFPCHGCACVLQQFLLMT